MKTTQGKYTFMHVEHMHYNDIEELYHMVVDLGYADSLFYDGGIKSVEMWVPFIRSQWMVRVLEGGIDRAMFWLNGFQGRTAQMHFCIWPDAEKLDTAEATVKWLAGLGLFESLYGCTPKPFKHVVKFMTSAGFAVQGELPGACYIAKHDRHVPGVISVLDLTSIDKGEE